MFGYIAIDKQKLKEQEIGLYQTFLCGVCISTKKFFGNGARNFVSYDINFFNILFHSYLQTEVTIDQARCISSPFKKRSILHTDDLTDKMAIANVLLNYYNLYDDVLDEKSLKKRIVLRNYIRAYNKAKVIMPELDKTIGELYSQLRKLEQSRCNILDKICHNFASLSQVFAKIVLGDKANKYILDLSYNMGKWIYLIDALDDLAKDNKRGNFNPLINYFGGYENDKQFITDNYDELRFIFYTTLNKIAESYNDLNLTKYICLLNNIIYNQIRDKTKAILDRFLEEKR